jgi:membrane protease YdiL (CAAX protease family)
MEIKGIGLCVLIFSVFLVMSWAFNATSLAAIQKQYLYWNYFSHTLMILLGISMIAFQKADFQSYGFTLKKWRFDLSVAVICVISAAGFIPSLIYHSIAGNEPVNTLFGVAASLLALVFVVTKKNKSAEGKSGLSISSFILATPLIIIGTNTLAGSGLIASTIVFQFFFAGFGEEILFRGYMQTRLNEDFGKPWRLKGVSFGPGLLISAALFGVLHLLNPLNPFMGQHGLNVWLAISSSFTGLLFGFVREKTGTVLSPSIAHGLVDIGQVVPLLL